MNKSVLSGRRTAVRAIGLLFSFTLLTGCTAHTLMTAKNPIRSPKGSRWYRGLMGPSLSHVMILGCPTFAPIQSTICGLPLGMCMPKTACFKWI